MGTHIEWRLECVCVRAVYSRVHVCVCPSVCACTCACVCGIHASVFVWGGWVHACYLYYQEYHCGSQANDKVTIFMLTHLEYINIIKLNFMLTIV